MIVVISASVDSSTSHSMRQRLYCTFPVLSLWSRSRTDHWGLLLLVVGCRRRNHGSRGLGRALARSHARTHALSRMFIILYVIELVAVYMVMLLLSVDTPRHAGKVEYLYGKAERWRHGRSTMRLNSWCTAFKVNRWTYDEMSFSHNCIGRFNLFFI